MKALLFSTLWLTSPLLAWAQTICTINANSNWSTCTCAETGLAPVNGNTVVVSAGKTLTIDVNTAPFFIGNINVFGILDANQTGARLDGSIHIFSGGTLQLDKQLSLGNAGGCGYGVSIDNGGSMTIPGAGASALLTICGVAVAQSNGACNTYPTGPPPYCTPGGGWPGTGFSLDETGNGGINYTWKGTTSNWTTSTNWTPTRSTLTTKDLLTFDATGTNKNIASIPTETEGSILVTGSSTYSFAPASASNTLTLSNIPSTGNAFQIDNGSSLTLGGGNTLNLTMPSSGIAQIGGLLTLNNTIFNVSSATLLLHTSSSPLAVANGSKISTDGSTILQFGKTGFTSGTITLPDGIFNGAPTISSVVMNTASATLGNQTITVNSSVTLTSGILNTNASGSASINFSLTATDPAPTESTTSYISGVAVMTSRAVGTGTITFLDATMTGTSDVGNVAITRTTGSLGINTFLSAHSIASTWMITASTVPSTARTLSFKWQSPLDNGNNPAINKFQTYINTGSGFTTIGALQNLAAQGPPRQSATVSTTSLSSANTFFTLADQANVLPITLLYFTGEPESGKVLLNWATASELNFDHFDLDKSEDGKIFHSIARIKGNGTTNERHDYSFEDGFPFIGKNYYRLTSVDFDNYRETFNVIVQEYSGNKDFQVSPNPSDGRTINLNFNFDSKEGQVVIYDSMGSIVDSFQIDKTSEVSFANVLKNGIYFAKYSSPSFTKAVRFLVQQ